MKPVVAQNAFVTVHHCNFTNDYYVDIAFPPSGVSGPFEMLDNHNSQFQYIKTDNEFTVYCAYVKGLDDTYTLTINGEVVEFNQ